MEKSKLLFCQKLINLQNLKNVTHIDIMFHFLETGQQKNTLSTTNLEAGNLMMNYTVNADNDCGLPSMQKVAASDVIIL